MAHKQLRINEKQAMEIGFLASETGLAIIDNLLTVQHFKRAAIVGGVPRSYWRNLLGNVRPLPYVFSELGVVPDVQTPSIASASVVMTAQHSKQRLSDISIRRSVQQLVMGVMGKEEIDSHQPLAYQGLDSLSGLELRQQIHVSKLM